MDIEDEGWVNIPYDGLLEVHDDGGKKYFSRKFVRSPKNLFKMDYFDSSTKFEEFIDLSSSSEDDPRSPKKLIAFPIHMDDDQVVDHHEDVKEITKLPILVDGELTCAPESDQDPIFQVFFKKENEFVEMKMDSPKSGSRRISSPYIEADVFKFEDKSDDHMDDHMFNGSSPSKGVIDEKVIKGESNEGFNIWKWSLNGIGTFFSIGMAAATICIILFGNSQRHKQNQKLRIQLYSDDKRIKQVVHHANEAMSAVRGVPLTTAHITYGGYYEGF